MHIMESNLSFRFSLASDHKKNQFQPTRAENFEARVNSYFCQNGLQSQRADTWKVFFCSL